MILQSNNEKQTQKIAAKLAWEVAKKEPGRAAKIIALEGELGAGKTTFIKGFARALGIKTHITSPTFVILKLYPIKEKKFQTLFHIDAYRLKDHKELLSLGVKEIFDDPENIVLIEWSDRVKKILPKKCIKIHIDHINQNSRKIRVSTF